MDRAEVAVKIDRASVHSRLLDEGEGFGSIDEELHGAVSRCMLGIACFACIIKC